MVDLPILELSDVEGSVASVNLVDFHFLHWGSAHSLKSPFYEIGKKRELLDSCSDRTHLMMLRIQPLNVHAKPPVTLKRVKIYRARHRHVLMSFLSLFSLGGGTEAKFWISW